MLKKSFTLIELLLTLFLASILLWFAFSYQLNFSKEINHLKSQEKLAMESFKFMELLTKGFMVSDTEYISGLISLAIYKNPKTYEAHLKPGKTISYRYDNNFTKIYDETSGKGYTSKKVMTSDTIKLSQVRDKDANYADGLYLIKFDSAINPEYHNLTISNPTYFEYERLVYTK